MSTQSAWSVAWTWANSWWGTLRFWLTEVVVAGLAFTIVFATTDDPSWAAAATLLAAVLTFLGGLVWKVWATTSEERRIYRAAVVRLAEATSEFPRNVDLEATNPSQMEQNVERFRAYVDEQIEKLSAASASAQASRVGTEEFMMIASRTSSGIRRFDSSLGDYMDKAIDQLYNDYDEISTLSLGGVNSILEAVNESRVLYDGRDPVV